MIDIDGSAGEGGGQILRTALTLSSITQKPFRMREIRKNRSSPGLQPQHLMAAISTQRVCRGDLQGAELHSTEIAFYPGNIVGGNYTFDIGTAGSAILVLQTLMPILMFAATKSVITVFGGTHLPKSPSYDYFEQVFLPAVRRFNVAAEACLNHAGYYPKGGGEVILTVEPSRLRGCTQFESQGPVQGMIRLGSLPSHIASRERQVLVDAKVEKIKVYEESTLSPGNAILIWQGFKGATSLGERGKRAESVAAEACQAFAVETAPIDRHLADQILLYAALAEGESQYCTSQISEHFKTNLYVISQFLMRNITYEERCVKITDLS